MSDALKSWLHTLGTLAGSVVLLFVVTAIGGAIFWAKKTMMEAQMAAPPPPEMPEAVTLVQTTPMTYRQNVTSIGTVLSPRWITLRNEIAGRIVSMPLEDGSLVEKGQVLFELDHSVEDAQLKSAKARARIAKSVYDRTKRAADANASSGTEVDQADGELAQASAEVERLEAVIEKKTMRAPFRARVGLIDTHLGQYLMEGVEITTLQGIDDYMHVDFMMPEAVADAIKVGQPVSLLHGTSSLEGQLIAVAARADRSTRNLMGRARVDHPPAELQPNDSVKVLIEYGPPIEVMTVPASALRREPTGAFVFVAEPDQEGKLRAQQRTVRVGGTLGKSVAILEGLDNELPVIADGSFKLHAGALVGIAPAQGSEDNDATAQQQNATAKPIDATAKQQSDGNATSL